MNTILDRAFPEEQCIPDKTLRVIEDRLGIDDALHLIGSTYPWDHDLGAIPHVQAPFSHNAEGFGLLGICFANTEAFDQTYNALRGVISDRDWSPR